MTDQEMAREKQINFRVSEEEAARFDLVAEHYGLAVSAAIRMLVKREAEQLRPVVVGRESSVRRPDFQWREEHTHVLTVVARARDPISAEDIRQAMHEGVSGTYYDGRWRGLSGALNLLTHDGYLRRLKRGYVITPKGQKTIK